MNPYIESVLAQEARRIQMDLDYNLELIARREKEIANLRSSAATNQDRLAQIKTHMELLP